MIEEKGGGIFEMDWYERAKLLRQMVDWQCECGVGVVWVDLTTRPDLVTHAETIRAIINADNNVSSSKAQKAVTVPEGGTKVEPIGMDRNKNRIWHLDCE
jgi:hypothetical protein